MSNEPKTTEPKTEPKKEKKPNKVIAGFLWEPINPKGSPTEGQDEPAPDPRVEALTQEIASLKRQLLALVTGSEGWGKTDRIKALEEKIAELEAKANKPEHVSVWDNPVALKGKSQSNMGIASRRGRAGVK